MTTKAETRRLENLAKRKEVESIRWAKSQMEAMKPLIKEIMWSQDKVNSLVADYQKTIETTTAKVEALRKTLVMKDKQIAEFIRRLKDDGGWHRHPDSNSTITLDDEVDVIAKETFK